MVSTQKYFSALTVEPANVVVVCFPDHWFLKLITWHCSMCVILFIVLLPFEEIFFISENAMLNN